MIAAAPLRRVWLVVNAGSGSTDEGVASGLKAKLAAAGIDLVGETDFPGDTAPNAGQLDAAGADTLLICGGDGTINAAWRAADDWRGQCLVLPGGTMNGLAKALHGDAAHDAILGAAAFRLTHPPIAVAGDYRAMVGVILGPAAAWVHAREGVRKGRIAHALRAARLAWSRSFSRSIRIAGETRHHRAVIVTPGEDGLEVAAVSAAGISDAIRIGWDWLRGDWRAGPGVVVRTVAEVTLTGRRHVKALFDGEPATLASPVRVLAGRTRLGFVATA